MQKKAFAYNHVLSRSLKSIDADHMAPTFRNDCGDDLPSFTSFPSFPFSLPNASLFPVYSSHPFPFCYKLPSEISQEWLKLRSLNVVHWLAVWSIKLGMIQCPPKWALSQSLWPVLILGKWGNKRFFSYLRHVPRSLASAQLLVLQIGIGFLVCLFVKLTHNNTSTSHVWMS